MSDAAQRIRQTMPDALRDMPLFGFEAWQWAILGLVSVAGICLIVIVRTLVGSLLMRRLAAGDDGASVRAAVRALACCAAALFWLRALPLTGMDGLTLTILQGGARLLALGSLAWLGLRLADLAGERLNRTWARTPSRLDDLLGPLVRKLLKVLAVGIAVIYALRGLGFEVAPLVASLGLGGLALAFAAKDTIENFFGSIAVIVDRPFEVGDTIAVAGIEGQVIEVGFRSTRLLTTRGTMLTLPNATLVRAAVERIGDATRQVVGFTLRLDAGTAPEQVIALRDGIRAIVLAHPRTADDEVDVRLASISDGGLDVLVRVVLEAADKASEREDRERILLEVLALVKALDLTLGAARPNPALPQPQPVSAPPPEPEPEEARP